MSLVVILSIFCLGVAYISLWVALQLTQHAKEPPLVLHVIPFLSPIIGLISRRWRFFLGLRDEYGLSIYTLRMPWSRYYVISDTRLVPAVDRQVRTISFAPIEANATASFLGTTKITNEIMRRDPTGDQGHFNTFHKSIRPALSPGPGLDAMLAGTFKVMESSLSRLSQQTPKPVELFRWVRHEMLLATTTGEYGPANPFLDPNVEQSWYEFLPGVPFLASGFFPRLFARKSFQAREKLSQRFEQYFARSDHVYGGSAALLARERHGISTGLPACDRARGEVGSTMALVNNTVPSTFWLLCHIFSEPAILEECRSELSRAIRVDPDGTHALDLVQVRSHCPIFVSTLNEVYRYHGVGTVLIRQVVEDHMLNDTYLLKKGAFVLMPTSVQHYSEAVWGPDVNIFNHRRFVGAGNCDPSKRHDPAGFRVFGGGALLCPGRHFANNAILAFAAMVILRFDMHPVARDLSCNDWGSVEVEKSFGLNIARMLLQPESDVRVEMSPSNEWAGRPGAPWRVQVSG